jgi:hypothetical protein
MNRDEPFGPEPLARWYYAAALASFLFMAFGCFTYFLHVSTDPASLPADQRQLAALLPWWHTAGYALGVWAGLAGSIGLLLRRRWAEPLLGLSVAGVAIWISAFFLVREIRETASTDVLSIPVVVLVLTWTIFWFARHSRQRTWLR